MNRLMFCTALCMSVMCSLKAQPARDSVIAVVNGLFKGMKNADTALLISCFAPGAILQTVQDDKGDVKVNDEKLSDFASFVGKETAGAADEQIAVETVRIDGAMASVWAPYKFFYKGKFSHCGVDAFLLVRLSGGWKIQYIVDTRRKDACP